MTALRRFTGGFRSSTFSVVGGERAVEDGLEDTLGAEDTFGTELGTEEVALS